MRKKLLILILILASLSSVFAQDEPPPMAAPKSSGEKPKPFSWGSIRSLPAATPFVSLEGRFSIGLSKQIQGYGGFSPNQSGINAIGDRFSWKFDEGEIAVVYLEFPETDLKGTDEELQKYTNITKENILTTSPNAKVRDETYFKFNVLFPASKTTFNLSDNKILIQRTYLIRNRMYRMVAVFQNAEDEKFVNSAFDTFKIISKEDIEAELQRKYEEMKPAPLPQTPVVQKLKSDAQDEGLKGKVKKIVEERQEIRNGIRGEKRISHAYFYNESGNLIQSDYYDWKGNPSSISVYGYIDGKRVSTSKWTSYEYDPPAPAAPKKKAEENLPKPDPRYQSAYEYKYVGGFLVEKQTFSNTGQKGTLYIYNRKDNQIEELSYDSKGELVRKDLITIDKDGNEIEQIFFGLKNKDIYGDAKYRYSYEEFDKQGNWIKQSATREVTENGVTSFKPEYIKYRTITYW